MVPLCFGRKQTQDAHILFRLLYNKAQDLGRREISIERPIGYRFTQDSQTKICVSEVSNDGFSGDELLQMSAAIHHFLDASNADLFLHFRIQVEVAQLLKRHIS